MSYLSVLLVVLNQAVLNGKLFCSYGSTCISSDAYVIDKINYGHDVHLSSKTDLHREFKEQLCVLRQVIRAMFNIQCSC